jgi:predicted transcriptional regulator
MIAILSIKAKYVEEILNGNKKYEFRKTSFKRDVSSILVYATKPVGKIVCKLQVGDIIEDRPQILWRDFKEFSGLSKKEFFAYFGNKNKGTAIEIKEVEEFPEPINPNGLIPNFVAPQSWSYIPEEKLNCMNIHRQ